MKRESVRGKERIISGQLKGEYAAAVCDELDSEVRVIRRKVQKIARVAFG